MTAAQKLRKIADGMQDVFDAGHRKADRLCQSRHFSAVVTGDGTTELTLPIPFEPDLIEIVNHDPDIRATKGIVAFCQLNPAALGQLGGTFAMTSGPTDEITLGSYTNVLAAVTSLSTRFRRNDDGTVTVGNLAYGGMQGVWGKGVEYLVTAIKSVTKTDKERLTEIMARLPEGGRYRVYICQKKKEGAFTDDEWKALIATRPTYTFLMV